MTIRDQIIADESIFFNTDDFAEAIVYNGENILAIETTISDQLTGLPGFVIPAATVLVSANDVARPKAGDSVTFRSRIYKVGDDPIATGDMWQINLVERVIQV